MYFCITCNYTPEAVQAMRSTPTASRKDAIEKLVTAAGGKLVCFFHTIDEGPGALAIIDAEPKDAMAMAALTASSGAVRDYKFRRLATPEEVVELRARGAELRAAYTAPGQ